MALQTTDVLNLLQKSIAKKIEDNVPQTTPLLSVLKRNEGATPMANNTFYVTEWVGNFSNIGQFAAGSQLVGGNAANVQFAITAKRLYADISVDEFTIEAMGKVPEGSLVDFVKGFTDRMELGVGREMNRTFHGDSTGKIARANGSASSSTALVVQALDADTSDLLGEQYIEVGDYIKIGSGAAVQVTAVAGTAVTIAAARAWSDEDAIKKASADGAAAVEMQGLKGVIVNTGTIQGVNIANYAHLQAYVDTTQHDISSVKENPMVLAYLKTAAHKASAALVGFCNVTVFNEWADILTALKKTANSKENISGGIQLQGDVIKMPYLNFMDGEVYLDIDAYTNHWYNTDPASMTIGDMGGGVKLSVGPDGKSVWTRKSGYVPEYEATLRFYGELIMKRPKANAVCTNLI